VFGVLAVWHYARVRIVDMASSFGVVLKKHRQAKGLSQEALAEKADIHPTHVSLIERCERNPSLNVAKSLATALGLSLTSLIREAEELQTNRHR
jgi:transcriptional regulator with XRE-family HTH domain